MTKDRRLGRGLAALLGSPLEEDQIVDSTAVEADTGQGRASARPDKPAGAAKTAKTTKTAKPALAGASGSQAASPKAPGAKPAGAKPAKQPSATNPSVRKNVAQVTGSVPLKTPDTSTGQQTAGAAGNTLELSVYDVDNNPFQPRRKFNEEEIGALAESIREHQQLQPILVRRVGKRFQLISGERRLRATIHAGLKTIRAEVREADDRLVAELAIVENLQRKDLDPIEKALSFRRYIDQHKCTQEDLAKRLKIDRSTIANLMRLLELPETIQEWIQSEKLTAGHARALLPLGDETQQLDFARQIKEETWTVRETERRVSEQLAIEDGVIAGSVTPAKGGSHKRSSPQVAALEQQLRLALGTKTEIRQNARGRGKIVISFANPEEFERLCALICPQLEGKAA